MVAPNQNGSSLWDPDKSQISDPGRSSAEPGSRFAPFAKRGRPPPFPGTLGSPHETFGARLLSYVYTAG